MIIKAGAVLVLETGEYSDYTFTGPFRVLRGFDQATVAKQFEADQRNDPDMAAYFEIYGGARPNDFVGWLAKHGYIEDIDHINWHVGSDKFEPQIADEPRST